MPITTITCCVSGDSSPNFFDTHSIPPASRSIIGASVLSTCSERSAELTFIRFIASVISSAPSCVFSNVVSMFPAASVRLAPRSSNESFPSRTAFAIAGPAFAPKSSIARAVASVSLSAPVRLSCTCASASFIGTPSFAAFCNAFLRPAMTCVLSAPDTSSCPRNFALSAAPKPISLKAALF